MKKIIHIYFLLISLLNFNACFCQVLDPSFGTSGKVITDFRNNSNDDLNAMALQGDGKIVVAGNSGWGFSLMRYGKKGALDTTFGTAGKVLTNYGIYNDVPYAVAIQNDGKILAAGFTYITQYYQDILIARYNANGSQDLLFGTNGAVIVDVANKEDIAYSLVVQPDGKILVSGTSINGQNHSCILLLRLNNDGTRDSTFGINGIVTNCTNNLHYCTSMALQNDGKIILGGGTLAGAPAWGDFALVRYISNGSLDSTFGTNGLVITDFASKDDAITAVTLQTDGKIVTSGLAYKNNTPNFAYARYNTDGSLDPTFANGGKATLAISSTNNWACANAIQPDGKILIGGWTLPPTPSYADLTLVRLNTNGYLDSTFDSDGILCNDLRNSPDAANAIIIQPDGKILVGGTSSNPSSYNMAEGDFALVRYENNTVSVKNNNTILHDLTISPNPTSGIFTVSYFSQQKGTIISVSNFLGQTIYKETNCNMNGAYAQDIDLSNHPKGLYIVEIICGAERRTRKIIID